MQRFATKFIKLAVTTWNRVQYFQKFEESKIRIDFVEETMLGQLVLKIVYLETLILTAHIGDIPRTIRYWLNLAFFGFCIKVLNKT